MCGRDVRGRRGTSEWKAGHKMGGSGRIYERAGIYFIAYSHGGHEFRESTRSRNIEDAQRLLASRIVVEPPKPATPPASVPDVPSLTFDQLAQLYLDDYETRQFRGPKTAVQRVKNLRTFFGTMLAAALSTALIRKYQSLRIRGGAAAATVNRETAALHRMCRLAASTGQLPVVPYFPESLPENPPRQGFFEHAEYLAVRAHLPAPYQDVLDFAYYSG